ncbi:MAG: hypothetical protein JKY48_12885 [Flavobacteriales bacterium]|nr:hypothetical protein [Flavobacteriales bacterium]
MAILLILVLVGTTSGISIYKHYCGDFLEEISIFIQSNSCADESGEDTCSAGKEMSCCDIETEYYQLEIDLVKTTPRQISFEITHQIILFRLDQESIIVKEPSNLEDLHIIEGVPIYKKLKRLTLYG